MDIDKIEMDVIYVNVDAAPRLIVLSKSKMEIQFWWNVLSDFKVRSVHFLMSIFIFSIIKRMIRVAEFVVVAILTNNQLARDRKVAIAFGIILVKKKVKCGLQNVIFVSVILEMGSNMERSCVRFSNAPI